MGLPDIRSVSQPNIFDVGDRGVDRSLSKSSSPLSREVVGAGNARGSSSITGCEAGAENAHDVKGKDRIDMHLSDNVDSVTSVSSALENKVSEIVSPFIDTGAKRTIELTESFYSYAVNILSSKAEVGRSLLDGSLKQSDSSISGAAEKARIRDIISDIHELKCALEERGQPAKTELVCLAEAKIPGARRAEHRRETTIRLLSELSQSCDTFLSKLSEASADPSKVKDAIAWLFNSVACTVACALDRLDDNVGHIPEKSADAQWNQLVSLYRICRAARELSLSECGSDRTAAVTPPGYPSYADWLQRLRDKIDSQRASLPERSALRPRAEEKGAMAKALLSDEELNTIARGIGAGAANKVNFFEKSVYLSTLATISALTNRDSKTALAEADKVIAATRELTQFREEASLESYVPKINAYDDDDVGPLRTMFESAQERIEHAIGSCKNFYEFAQLVRNKGGVWNSWTMPSKDVRMQVARAMLDTLTRRSEDVSYGVGAVKEQISQLTDSSRDPAAERTKIQDDAASVYQTCRVNHAWSQKLMMELYDFKNAIIDCLPNKNMSKFPLSKGFDAMERKIQASIAEGASQLHQLDTMSAS